MRRGGGPSCSPPEPLPTSTSRSRDAATAPFDVVVVIAPPLEEIDDALVLATGHAMLLAVTEHALSPEELKVHARRVRGFGARLVGTVLVIRRLERVAS